VSCSLWLSFLLLSNLLPAQPIISVPVRLIVAPTSVTDHSGNFINGLTASDFQLYDNDIPQQVHEDGDFLPISLAIAVQTNLKKQAVERVRDLGPLLGALVVGVGGEAAILTFSDKVEVQQKFTPDLGRLTRTLRGIDFSRGPSDPVKAVFEACQLLDGRPELRRRILLLISEPHPGNGSNVGPDVTLSNTLIYWLNVGHGASPEDVLSSLTRYTGGREYSIGNERSLERAITQIGDEIHGQYLLSYTPVKTGESGFHRIRVTTRRKGAEVRSRPGYWSLAQELVPSLQ
jgi:hypothetical protein